MENLIRIVSAGSGPGTAISLVRHDDDGEEVLHPIPHVTRADVTIEYGQRNRVVLHALDVEGRYDAILKELKLTPLPQPGTMTIVQVFAPVRHWFRRRSRLRIERHEQRGDGSWLICTPLVSAWVAPSEPLELRVPE